MAEAVDELMVKLGLETDAKGFQEAHNQIQAIRTSALATGAAITGAFAGMVSISNDVANSRDVLNKWSDAANVSVRSAQKLAYAMKHVGGGDQDALAMFERINALRDQAMRGELPKWASAEAGFDLYAIRNMDADETLDYFGRNISGIQDQERQRRLLNELGLSSPAASGIMTNYNQTQANYQRFNELGGASSDELLEQSAVYTSAVVELKQAVDKFKETIAGEMLPGMTRFVEGMTGVAVDNRAKIETAFKEAMPYLEAMATGIAVLVAAQVGKKGLAAMGGAGGATGLIAKAGIIGGAVSMWDWTADDFEQATGVRLPDWIFQPIGGSDSAPTPSAPPAPPSPRVIPRSTDRAPSAPPAMSGLTPDEMNYIPSPGEILPQGTDAEFIEGNRRLMRGYYPGAYASPPDMSRMNPQASTTYSPTIHVDARGSTDPLMTEERVRKAVRSELNIVVQNAYSDIPDSVA
jgi:hypothetical protein